MSEENIPVVVPQVVSNPTLERPMHEKLVDHPPSLNEEKLGTTLEDAGNTISHSEEIHHESPPGEEEDGVATHFSLVTEVLAPPDLDGAAQQEELKSCTIDATVTYDPEIPHTEEKVIFVRHCLNSITDIHICYQCFGELRDDTPVLLLVCGLNMQLFAWDEAFCEGLVRAGFFVIRYDNRDSGFSTKVPRGNVKGYRLLLPSNVASALGERLPYTLEDMAKDGLALLEALHIEHAHVMGISMGGMISQIMAIIAPHRIVSLTSIMSSTNARDLPDTQLKVKLWMLRKPPANCSLDTLLEFRINGLKRILPRTLSVDSRYLKKRYLISLKRSRYTEGLIRQAAAVLRSPSRDEALRKLTIPALVIHGTQDLIVPPAHGLRTASVLQHSRLLVLKHMGHYFHPSFYQTVITAFWAMAATTPYPSPVPPGQVFPSFPEDPISMEEEGEDITVPSPITQMMDSIPSLSSFSSTTAPFPSKKKKEDVTTAEDQTSSVSPVSAALDFPKEKEDASSIHPALSLRHSALQPVVVNPSSPCGKAVHASIAVAVPIDHSSNTPEAAILDLHDPNGVVTEEAREGRQQGTGTDLPFPVILEGNECIVLPQENSSSTLTPTSATGPESPKTAVRQAPSAGSRTPTSLSPLRRKQKVQAPLFLSEADGVTPFNANDKSSWNSATLAPSLPSKHDGEERGTEKVEGEQQGQSPPTDGGNGMKESAMRFFSRIGEYFTT